MDNSYFHIKKDEKKFISLINNVYKMLKVNIFNGEMLQDFYKGDHTTTPIQQSTGNSIS